MKLWLDHQREPDVDWVWSRTVEGAITMLRGGCVEKISFAPDQKVLVAPVVEWMMENDSTARCATHSRTGGARQPREVLKVDYPPEVL